MGTWLPPCHFKRKLMKFQPSTLKICSTPFFYACMSWSISLRQSLVTHTQSFNWFTQVSEQGIITSWEIKLGRRGQPASVLCDLQVQNKGRSGFIPQFDCKLQTAWCSEAPCELGLITSQPTDFSYHCSQGIKPTSRVMFHIKILFIWQ